MNDYTMTFKYDGDFDLPDNEAALKLKVPGMVLDKLRHHEFELIDFNLTQHYSGENPDTYISDPSLNRSVLEIRLPLRRVDLKSRESIYDRCLEAMEARRLTLSRAFENEGDGRRQSIIIFEKTTS